MLGLWLARVPLGDALVTELLDATDGVSGADLRSRAMAAARRHLMDRLPKPPPEPPPTPARTSRDLAQELLLTLERMERT
jgi:hypothetical protein